MSIKYYKDKVCINVLAGSLKNAKEIYKAAEEFAVIGVLSSKFDTLEEATSEMKKYMQVLNNNLSIGLGSGNPNQWKFVGDLSKTIKANHINQVFTGVGYTRANVNNNKTHVNALVSPSGTPGLVKISTGPLSAESQKPALVDVNTAIKMVKDMGGNSIKFFPMNGLAAKEELEILAAACARNDFGLEPTGGINLDNYEEILKIILDAGVKKIIPHVYSSIINKDTGQTKTKDVKKLLEITKKILD